MILSIIVAVSENGVIGNHGKLPWNLPKEMAYFRQTTVGHPIIMGRVTHESIGKTLPDRLNVVITRDKDYKPAKGSKVVTSLQNALRLPEIVNADEVFVIGGESINQQALPVTDRLYLTKVAANIKGDKFFKYDPSQWKLVWSQEHKADKENKYDYEFTVLERKNK